MILPILLPVLLVIWPYNGVLTTEHVLLVLPILIVWVHVDIDVLSDSLVSVMLNWLTIQGVREWWRDIVRMHAANLCGLVGDLVHVTQWYLESTGCVQRESLTILATEIWCTELGHSVRFVEVLEYLSCILASERWSIR